jgi:hypothetical protein
MNFINTYMRDTGRMCRRRASERHPAKRLENSGLGRRSILIQNFLLVGLLAAADVGQPFHFLKNCDLELLEEFKSQQTPLALTAKPYSTHLEATQIT